MIANIVTIDIRKQYAYSLSDMATLMALKRLKFAEYEQIIPEPVIFAVDRGIHPIGESIWIQNKNGEHLILTKCNELKVLIDYVSNDLIFNNELFPQLNGDFDHLPIYWKRNFKNFVVHPHIILSNNYDDVLIGFLKCLGINEILIDKAIKFKNS